MITHGTECRVRLKHFVPMKGEYIYTHKVLWDRKQIHKMYNLQGASMLHFSQLNQFKYPKQYISISYSLSRISSYLIYKMIQTGATDSSHCQTAQRFITAHTSWADFSEERRIVNSVTEKIKGDSFTALFESRVHTCFSKFHQFLDNLFCFSQEASRSHLQRHLICRNSLFAFCRPSLSLISRAVLTIVSAMIQNKIKRKEPPLLSPE